MLVCLRKSVIAIVTGQFVTHFWLFQHKRSSLMHKKTKTKIKKLKGFNKNSFIPWKPVVLFLLSEIGVSPPTHLHSVSAGC